MNLKLLKLALLATALVPGVAAAADYEPPPPVGDLRPASYDWTGVYAGVWVGSACMNGDATDIDGPHKLKGCGAKGGLAAGYNYQINNWVMGVEGDIGLGSKIAKNDLAAVDYHLNSIGTVRGRLGYAFDDTLLFATAGGAFAEGKLSGLAGASSVPFSVKKSHVGWTVGAGIEHAFTENLRIRLDYLYTHMNRKNYHVCGTCDVDLGWGGEHEVRLGAVWAFNTF